MSQCRTGYGWVQKVEDQNVQEVEKKEVEKDVEMEADKEQVEDLGYEVI